MFQNLLAMCASKRLTMGQNPMELSFVSCIICDTSLPLSFLWHHWFWWQIHDAAHKNRANNSKAIENDETPFRWTMVKALLGWECLGCIGVYGGLYHLDLPGWIINSLDRNPYEHIRIWGNVNVTTVFDGFLNTAHILRRLNCWTTLFDGRNMVVTKVWKFQSLECISFSCRSPSSPEASNRKDLQGTQFARALRDRLQQQLSCPTREFRSNTTVPAWNSKRQACWVRNASEKFSQN